MDAHAKVEFGLASLEQAEDGSYVITYELTATQGIPVGSSLSLSLSRHNKETGQLIKEYEEVIAGSVPFMAEGTVVSGSAPLFPPLNLDGEFVATLALYGVAGNLVSLTSLGEITLTNPTESVPVRVTCRAVTASGG